MTSVKRLRIFAGPNGSGKSTLIKLVNELHVHLGVYVNADEIEIELDTLHFLDFNKYTVTLEIDHLKRSLLQSSFYISTESEKLSACFRVMNNCLHIDSSVIKDNKLPSFLADYIRSLLLNTCDKFTFETVMSHSSKLDFIRLAKSLDYRVYLYSLYPQMTV